MRRFIDLTPEDFPGVDPKKFEAWKEGEIIAMRSMWVAPLLILGTGLVTIPLFGGVPGYLLPLVAYFVYSISIGVQSGAKTKALTKELGITREAIRKAQMREARDPAEEKKAA